MQSNHVIKLCVADQFIRGGRGELPKLFNRDCTSYTKPHPGTSSIIPDLPELPWILVWASQSDRIKQLIRNFQMSFRSVEGMRQKRRARRFTDDTLRNAKVNRLLSNVKSFLWDVKVIQKPHFDFID